MAIFLQKDYGNTGYFFLTLRWVGVLHSNNPCLQQLMPDHNGHPATNVLYVDDEVHNLNSFKASFRRAYNVFITESISTAMQILENNEIHIIISDQRMPEMTGIEFFESILDAHPEPIRMLLTGYADINAVIGAINKGQVYKYFSKPWDEAEIMKTISEAYEIYCLRKENKELTEKLLDANEKLEFLLRQKLLS